MPAFIFHIIWTDVEVKRLLKLSQAFLCWGKTGKILLEPFLE